MTLTAAERGDLAERMLPVAAQLACIVHGDGDWHDIDHHTRQLDRAELLALIVDLAAMVDPDQRVDVALGHVVWDEYGRPAPGAAFSRSTVRGLAKDVDGPLTLGAARVLESERVLRARHLYMHDGLTVAEVARAVGAAERTVKAWRDDGGWRQTTVTDADARRTRGIAA